MAACDRENMPSRSSSASSSSSSSPSREFFTPKKVVSPESDGPGGLTIGIPVEISSTPSPSGLSKSINGLSSENPSTVLPPAIVPLSIVDDSPAAEALRANAAVCVTKLSKLARSIHAQSVSRSFVKPFKNAVRLRQSAGNRRGKPPRLPSIRNIEESQFGGSEFSSEHGSEVGDMVQKREKKNTRFGKVLPKGLEEEGNSGSEESFYSIDEVLPLLTSETDGDKTSVNLNTHTPIRSVNSSSNLQHRHYRYGKLMADGNTARDRKKRQRKRMKKKKSKKNRKSYVKGKVIDGKHELYTLSIAMMLGLRTSLNRTNKELREVKEEGIWLKSEDFMTIEKYSFPPKGSYKTPPHQLGHTFKVKAYSPLAFAYIRRLFGINENDFLLSVCGNANFIEFISNAKSGQFFFYSQDGKYMIKTMTNDESKFLRRILPHYFKHCSKNVNTFITKFLGMYRVKLYHLRRNVKFVVMNSVFDTEKQMQTFYDLKGSVTGREAPHQDVKKDNDLRNGFPDSALVLPVQLREQMKTQLQKDCQFMTSMKIMDYSMLVGVHHIPSRVAGYQSRSEIAGLSFRKMRTSCDLTTSLPKNTSKTDVEMGLNLINREKDSKIESLDESSEVGSNHLNDKSKERSLTNVQGDPSLASMSTMEACLDDDDEDDSYIGSRGNYDAIDDTDLDFENQIDEYWTQEKKFSTLRKESATEVIFWPFHRFYKLNGERRMAPLSQKEIGLSKISGGQSAKLHDCLESKDHDKSSSSLSWDLPEFELPLSKRKDSGFEMEVTENIPMKYQTAKSIQYYDGKIFYMGIIDILQKFGLRKRLESKLRRLQGSGWQDASCVPPQLYADRFIRFFDQYTKRNDTSLDQKEIGDDESEEEVVFMSCGEKPPVVQEK